LLLLLLSLTKLQGAGGHAKLIGKHMALHPANHGNDGVMVNGVTEKKLQLTFH
jgi:hypothetical protein